MSEHAFSESTVQMREVEFINTARLEKSGLLRCSYEHAIAAHGWRETELVIEIASLPTPSIRVCGSASSLYRVVTQLVNNSSREVHSYVILDTATHKFHEFLDAEFTTKKLIGKYLLGGSDANVSEKTNSTRDSLVSNTSDTPLPMKNRDPVYDATPAGDDTRVINMRESYTNPLWESCSIFALALASDERKATENTHDDRLSEELGLIHSLRVAGITRDSRSSPDIRDSILHRIGLWPSDREYALDHLIDDRWCGSEKNFQTCMYEEDDSASNDAEAVVSHLLSCPRIELDAGIIASDL